MFKNSFIVSCGLVMVNIVPAQIAAASDKIYPLSLQEIRVQIVAQDEARFLSPMTGLILEVSKKDGHLVEKDETIVSFDCQALEAQLDQTVARINKQTRIVQSAKRRQKLGSESKSKVMVLTADLQEAQAAHRLAEKQVTDCTIKAPFSGRIAMMSVSDYHSIQQGQPLFNLTSNRNLETKMIVPSKWMKWLKKNDHFQIEIDETAKIYDMKIDRYGGQVDPVSQSIQVYGTFSDPLVSGLLSGMSGKAIFVKKVAANLDK